MIEFRVTHVLRHVFLLLLLWFVTVRTEFHPAFGRINNGVFFSNKDSNVTRYQDSVSIDCGYKGDPYYSDVGLVWIPDTFNSGGISQQLFNAPDNVANFSMEVTLNYYPNGKINCYEIPMSESGRYLVRTTFWYNNYDKKDNSPSIIVSFGITIGGTIILHNANNVYNPEFIFTTNDGWIRLCLIRSNADPIINGIEVRKLSTTSYDANQIGDDVMQVWWRLACGNYESDASSLRYPSDSLDRIWYTDNSYQDNTNDYSISPSNFTSISIPSNYPFPLSSTKITNMPSFLLYTARTVPNDGLSLSYNFKHVTFPAKYMIRLYFTEISLNNVSTGDRIFDIYLNYKIALANFDILKYSQGQKFVTVNVSLSVYQSDSDGDKLRILFRPSSNCIICRPIVSGIEVIQIQSSPIPTYTSETSALLDFKKECDLSNSLNDWKYDPCHPIQWTGVTCRYSKNETTIISLELNNFKLTGLIPSSISKLKNIKLISLSNNKFEGSIPNDFNKLTQLKTLDLSNNSLTGDVISLSQNVKLLLTGNSKLCSSKGLYSLPSCTIINQQSQNETESQRKSKPSSSSKLIIPIVIGCIISLVTLFAIVILCLLRSRKIKSNKNSSAICQESFAEEGKVKPSLSSSSPLLSFDDYSHIQKFKFTLKQMQMATDNFHFSKQIGQGGFGFVFSAELADGRLVAVKQRNGDSVQGKKEFYNEVSLLSRVHFIHLVNLVGYCDEYDNQILVYDYIKNGSLKDHLYDSKGKPLGKLNWKTRLSIAIGAAKGIEYLHNGIKPSIIHRDIKTSNILLDENNVAKVADFGLSRQMKQIDESHASTFVKGTAGYVDPEYYTLHRLTDKSDVYSFGVVLLELIAGREPIDLNLKREQWSLVEWSRQKLMEKDINPIIDPTLDASEYSQNAMWDFAELAILCVEPSGDNRPSISKVCQVLNSIYAMEDGGNYGNESVDNFDENYLNSEGTFSDLNTDNDTITDSEFANSISDR